MLCVRVPRSQTEDAASSVSLRLQVTGDLITNDMLKLRAEFVRRGGQGYRDSMAKAATIVLTGLLNAVLTSHRC